jgi:hypothetical protein
MKSYIRPQNITDWFVAIGIFFSVAIYTFRRILIFSNPNYNFLSVFDRLIIFDNYELLGFGIGMCAVLITGVQKLKTSTKRKGVSYLINGFLTAIFLIGLNILVSFLLPNLVENLMISDERLIQIESRSNKENIEPDIKNRLRETVAEKKYLKTGTVSQYVNANGETIEYKPALESIRIRKNIEIMLSASARAQTWAIIWATVLIVSLLVGFMLARDKVTNQVKEP